MVIFLKALRPLDFVRRRKYLPRSMVITMLCVEYAKL